MTMKNLSKTAANVAGALLLSGVILGATPKTDSHQKAFTQKISVPLVESANRKSAIVVRLSDISSREVSDTVLVGPGTGSNSISMFVNGKKRAYDIPVEILQKELGIKLFNRTYEGYQYLINNCEMFQDRGAADAMVAVGEDGMAALVVSRTDPKQKRLIFFKEPPYKNGEPTNRYIPEGEPRPYVVAVTPYGDFLYLAANHKLVTILSNGTALTTVVEGSLGNKVQAKVADRHIEILEGNDTYLGVDIERLGQLSLFDIERDNSETRTSDDKISFPKGTRDIIVQPEGIVPGIDEAIYRDIFGGPDADGNQKIARFPPGAYNVITEQMGDSTGIVNMVVTRGNDKDRTSNAIVVYEGATSNKLGTKKWNKYPVNQSQDVDENQFIPSSANNNRVSNIVEKVSSDKYEVSSFFVDMEIIFRTIRSGDAAAQKLDATPMSVNAGGKEVLGYQKSPRVYTIGSK